MSITDIHSHSKDLAPGGGLRIFNVSPLSGEMVFSQPFTSGIHPCFQEHSQDQISVLQTLVNSPFCLAIGECGLDRRQAESMEMQRVLFVKQIDMAVEYSLPIVIHAVKTHAEIVQMLKKKVFPHAVLFHGFNNRMAVLREVFSNKNAHVSFNPGMLASPGLLRALVMEVPDNRLHLESDEHNTEVLLRLQGEVSKIKNMQEERLSDMLRNNAFSIFPKLHGLQSQKHL